MKELRLFVPTYNYSLFPEEVDCREKAEFGEPSTPVLIREAEGVRIILGSHDCNDMSVPDVQIERQPNGWVVFLHPLGGSDASGYVYMRDDGRSFVARERGVGPTPVMEDLKIDEPVPGFNSPQ